MSDPTPPRPGTPAHSTRQQLDELEALMQQMLALPVNEIGADTGPIPELPSFALSEGPVTPEETQAPSPPAGSPALGSRETIPWHPPILAAETAAAPWPDRRPEASEQNGARSTLAVLSDSPPLPAGRYRLAPLAVAEETDSPGKGQRLPRAGWWFRSLVWSNRTFDRGAAQLGRPGRWLRGPRGRTWLGWMGVVFLVAALAWGILDVMGWTW